MKPYGMSRDEFVEHPDVDDIKRMGAASHVGRLPSKSGEYDGYCTPVEKARTRRRQKRNARREGKQSIVEQLKSIEEEFV